MNLILLKKKDFIAHDQVVISGRRFEHLKRVNKVKLHDRLACGLLGDKMGTGTVVGLSDTTLQMQVCLENEPPEPLPLTLVLALPRPKMLRRIIQNLTTLGVKQIHLINSWRVEKSFWKSPVLSQDSLQQQMILGLEQGCDTILPEIHQQRFFTRFVNEQLPHIAKDAVCITAHPKSDTICPAGISKKGVLVIGPEGGFIDVEVETLEKNGFMPYHIGKRILKVETAVTSLIARLYT